MPFFLCPLFPFAILSWSFFSSHLILRCQFFRPPWRVWQWKVSQCYFKLFFGVVLLIQSIICHIIWRCLVVLLCHFHGCLIVRCLNVRCLNTRCLVVRCLVVLDSSWLRLNFVLCMMAVRNDKHKHPKVSDFYFCHWHNYNYSILRGLTSPLSPVWFQKDLKIHIDYRASTGTQIPYRFRSKYVYNFTILHSLVGSLNVHWFLCIASPVRRFFVNYMSLLYYHEWGYIYFVYCGSIIGNSRTIIPYLR